MRRGRRELMLGAHRDPFFGPVVVVGDGGKYVEAMPDAALLLPPFDEDDVRRAIGRLTQSPVIAGTRGEPPLTLDRYLTAAVGRPADDAKSPHPEPRREPHRGRP